MRLSAGEWTELQRRPDRHHGAYWVETLGKRIGLQNILRKKRKLSKFELKYCACSKWLIAKLVDGTERACVQWISSHAGELSTGQIFTII